MKLKMPYPASEQDLTELNNGVHIKGHTKVKGGPHNVLTIIAI
jgi:hypothetical protein